MTNVQLVGRGRTVHCQLIEPLLFGRESLYKQQQPSVGLFPHELCSVGDDAYGGRRTKKERKVILKGPNSTRNSWAPPPTVCFCLSLIIEPPPLPIAHIELSSKLSSL